MDNTRLKPYSEYKPSCIEWVDDVPAHWYVKRLKSVCSKIVGGSTPKSDVAEFWDGEVKWVTPTDVSKSSRLRNSLRKITPAGLLSCSTELVPAGSIVVTTRAPVGNIAMAETELCTNQGCKSLVVSNEAIDPEYAYNLLNVMKPELQSRAMGTTFTELGTGMLGATPIPLPPLDEQIAIVRYLDQADERIRRAISAKERLVDLLEERRKAATLDAMQSAGATNLRLEVVADLVQRPVMRLRERSYTAIGLYNRGRGIFLKEPRNGNDLGESEFFWVEKGDLVISGQFAWEGAIALAADAEDGCVASHRYPILRGKPGILNSAYLLAFFQTAWGQLILDHYSRGAAGRNRPLNAKSLMKEKVILPTIDSQLKIAEMLRQETHLRQQVILTKRLLNEYRTRLIADVVTGQVDVRDTL